MWMERKHNNFVPWVNAGGVEFVQGAIFECLWCVQTTRAMFAHAGAQSFFFLREARTLASRERCGHLVLQSSVRLGHSHKEQRISRLKFLKHVPAIAFNSIVAISIDGR